MNDCDHCCKTLHVIIFLQLFFLLIRHEGCFNVKYNLNTVNYSNIIYHVNLNVNKKFELSVNIDIITFDIFHFSLKIEMEALLM